MKKLTLFPLTTLLLAYFAQSQGCIIVRNISGLGNTILPVIININNRYFKAYRDYNKPHGS